MQVTVCEEIVKYGRVAVALLFSDSNPVCAAIHFRNFVKIQGKTGFLLVKVGEANGIKTRNGIEFCHKLSQNPALYSIRRRRMASRGRVANPSSDILAGSGTIDSEKTTPRLAVPPFDVMP